MWIHGHLHLNPICIRSKPPALPHIQSNTPAPYCKLTFTQAPWQCDGGSVPALGQLYPRDSWDQWSVTPVRLSSMNRQHGAVAHRKVAACMLPHYACASRQHHAHASPQRLVSRMAAYISIADQRCSGSLSNRRRSAVCCAAGADDPEDSASLCNAASVQHSSI